jgi:hypothetical protein
MGDAGERRRRQRLAAGEKALVRRRWLAGLKKDMRDGTLDPFRVIAGEYPEIEARLGPLKIESFLKMIPGIGPVGVFEICRAGKFSPIQGMDTLSPERRMEMARLAGQLGLGYPGSVSDRAKRRAHDRTR